MLSLLLFKKGYEKTEKGKTIKYYRYFVSEPTDDFKMSATLSNKFKDKLEGLGVDFPLMLDMDNANGDYFFAKETYADKTGEIDMSYKIVINDAREISHADIQQTTFEEAKSFNQQRKK